LRDHFHPGVRAGLTVDPGQRLNTVFGPEQTRSREIDPLEITEKIVPGWRPVIQRAPDGVPDPLAAMRVIMPQVLVSPPSS
jgi:hypothetical protein